MRRVVVTGIGCVSPLGCTWPATWDALVEGRSSFSKVTFGRESFAVSAVQNGPFDAALNKSSLEFLIQKPGILSRASKFALAAAHEALANAQLTGRLLLERNTGVSIGVGIPEFAEIEKEIAQLRGGKRVSPRFIPRILLSGPASIVAMRYKLRGPCIAPTTACATGAHCIGDAFLYIKGGISDCMLAGATESSLDQLTLSAFANAKAISVDAQNPCRPFDRDRTGFVLGEGATVLILESYDSAASRGASIKAEIVGFSATCDAFHETAPLPLGEAAIEAMKSCLKMAEAAEPDYVNAHATGTLLGDEAEANALLKLFGNRTPVSSVKGNFGHLLAAAGAIEAAVTIQSVQSGVVLKTQNLRNSQFPQLDIVKEKHRMNQSIQLAISNSFGFGGFNACLAFKKFYK